MRRVLCNNGEYDTDWGFNIPCTYKGGVKNVITDDINVPNTDTNQDTSNDGIDFFDRLVDVRRYTTMQKILAVVGFSAVTYYLLYKAGSIQ